MNEKFGIISMQIVILFKEQSNIILVKDPKEKKSVDQQQN